MQIKVHCSYLFDFDPAGVPNNVIKESIKKQLRTISQSSNLPFCGGQIFGPIRRIMLALIQVLSKLKCKYLYVALGGAFDVEWKAEFCKLHCMGGILYDHIYVCTLPKE